MGHVVASPDLCLVQSRLFSPGYAGIGRWVVFDATTRRAFSAVGRDDVPDVVRVLTRASTGATYEELQTSVPEMTPDKLARLQQAGLLLSLDGEPKRPASRTFVSSYQEATFNYPFYDYSTRDAYEEEAALLDRYAQLWPAPPSLLERSGEFYPLPRRALMEGPPEARQAAMTIACLGWALEHSFGPIGEINTKHASCIRRTSPSGGARHPAEVSIQLPNGIENVPAGSYTYDVARHGLVATPDMSRTRARLAAPTFTVHLRVDRAMWRYRDLRALRPVLLDVGHIVETLALLLDLMGMSTELTSPPVEERGEFAWLAEPPAATLTVGSAPCEARNVDVAGDLPDTQSDYTEAESILTNPATVLRFAGGQLHGRAVWPATRELVLDESDFRILGHCIPSTRGDRVTTTGGITGAVQGATPARVTKLEEANLLLPATAGEEFYRGVGLWVRHDWYLSMLAHLECLSEARTSPARSRLRARNDYIDTLGAVSARRTTRVFRDEQLTRSTIGEFLAQALDGIRSADALRWLRVFVAPLDVAGLSAQVHEWTGGALKPGGRHVTRDLIRDLTSGQQPAGKGACAIWLIGALDTRSAARYELGLIELGRVGQRLCLTAADLKLGIFLTPAVKDTPTLAHLGLDRDSEAAAYLFSIGMPRRSRK